MQSIEQTLEIQLFKRTKNKIEFNENGLYAVQQVQHLLTQIRQLKPMLLAHQACSVGTCAS